MTYGFVADDVKIGDLKKTLSDASTNITDYTEKIYAAVADMNSVWSGDAYNAFSAKCETYRSSLTRLTEILTAFSTELGTLGSSAGSAVTKIKALLNVSGVNVGDSTNGLSSISSNQRATDANGTMLPDSPNYGVQISIPSNTTLSNGEDCTAIGDAIYDSTMQVCEQVSTDLDTFYRYKEQYIDQIMALSEPQRSVVENALNREIVYRENVLKSVGANTQNGWFVADGAIFNATSYDHTGNVVGDMKGDQHAVNSSVAAAESINTTLSGLTTPESFVSYLGDLGLL